VIHGPAGERGLPAVGRDLDDAAAALGAQVRQGRADHLDGAGEVGGDDVVDLVVGELLGGADRQMLVIYQAEPGSRSAEALTFLAGMRASAPRPASPPSSRATSA